MCLHHFKQAKLYRLPLFLFYFLLPDLRQFFQALQCQLLICMDTIHTIFRKVFVSHFDDFLLQPFDILLLCKFSFLFFCFFLLLLAIGSIP